MFCAFMDLDKAYDRVDREGLWSLLQIYGIGGRLMRAVKSFYEGSRACVRVGRGEFFFFFFFTWQETAQGYKKRTTTKKPATHCSY